MTTLTHGGLFSGVGGFSLGFERAGIPTIWECEIDANCRKLLASKNQAARIHDDVCTFNPDDFPCPSVISFGSPCQDMSVAGKRAGMAGERSGLFYEAARIIRGFAGRGLEFAIWENVPGAFSSNGGRDFAGVLRAMAKCGALDVAWRVLDAQWFNVPQRRQRVFLVADFGGERAAEVLSLAQSLQGDPPPSRGAREGSPAKSLCGSDGGIDREDRHMLIAREVAHSLCSHAAKGGDPTTDNYAVVMNGVCGTLNAPGAGTRRPAGQANEADFLVAHSLRAEGFDASEDGTGRGTPLVAVPQLSATLRSASDSPAAHGKKNGTDRETLVAVAFHPTQDPISSSDGTTHALGCGSKQGQATVAVAFSPKDHGADATDDLSPTLRAGNHDKSHANGGCGPAVAFQTRIARNGRGQPEEICPALNGSDAGATSDMRPVVATFQQSSQSGRGTIGYDDSGIAKPTKTQTDGQMIHAGAAVRRLTPLECCRLMGWPDDWLDGFGFADGTKYRMCGNGCVATVTEWLGRRIMQALAKAQPV